MRTTATSPQAAQTSAASKAVGPLVRLALGRKTRLSGAAPDNLVFLPSANRARGPAALEAADVCAACGDVAVVRKGASLICETCGARAGRFGEDAGA